MPRAEAGSLKAISNQQKSKGLQRLRWYCQVCQRQMRDENGFKCHVQTEAHVRQMLAVGENAGSHIRNYSNQFRRDFLQLLRTSHGDKAVGLNHFYQSYISNKEHIHMNATRWKSLAEFGKMLGREGICRVEETDRGLTIAWIDNSPERLRQQEALRKRERQDKGDELREKKAIREQIERAKELAAEEPDEIELDKGLQRKEGEKIVLQFGKKAEGENAAESPQAGTSGAESGSPSDEAEKSSTEDTAPSKSPSAEIEAIPATAPAPAAAQSPISKPISIGIRPVKKNVFAAMKKKNPLSSKPVAPVVAGSAKPMTEAERIMRMELDRKRRLEESGGFRDKRIRM